MSEFRGVWAAWPTGKVDLSDHVTGNFKASSAVPWAECVPELHAANYNALMPCVACASATFFPGAPIPQHPAVAGRYDGSDQLAALVNAGALNGVKIYPWIVCWQMSAGFLAPSSVADTYRAQGRIALNADGTEQRMLCPSDQRNRADLLGTLTHIARRYAVAGVHLDYIRFDDTMGSFTAAARARFESWTGTPVTNWPTDVLGPRKETWQMFNREVITSFVREARAALKRIRPSFRLTAAVFPSIASGRERAQDWSQWVREGLLDWIAPMTYIEDAAAWATQVQGASAVVVAPRRMYPGISTRVGVPYWSAEQYHLVDPATTSAKLATARASKLGGWSLWQWGAGLPLPVM